jgi:hypothetical protein
MVRRISSNGLPACMVVRLFMALERADDRPAVQVVQVDARGQIEFQRGVARVRWNSNSTLGSSKTCKPVELCRGV